MRRTYSISSVGPGMSTTRSVCKLFRSPRPSSPLGFLLSSIRRRRSPYPAGPPCRNPFSTSLHCPAKTLDGELPTVLASHDTLDVFEQDRAYGAVVVKLLAAIMHTNASPRA